MTAFRVKQVEPDGNVLTSSYPNIDALMSALHIDLTGFYQPAYDRQRNWKMTIEFGKSTLEIEQVTHQPLKRFMALDHAGNTIISVHAGNRTDAEIKTKHALDRPGRHALLRVWIDAGMPLEEAD